MEKSLLDIFVPLVLAYVKFPLSELNWCVSKWLRCTYVNRFRNFINWIVLDRVLSLTSICHNRWHNRRSIAPHPLYKQSFVLIYKGKTQLEKYCFHLQRTVLKLAMKTLPSNNVTASSEGDISCSTGTPKHSSEIKNQHLNNICLTLAGAKNVEF